MIGYYAHHQGDGHVTRAGAIAAALDDELVVLSSRGRPEGWDGGWIVLPRDDDPPVATGDDGAVTAHGALHWAPAGHPGLRARMAAIAAWAEAARPRAMVVDVSVEVVVSVRAMGVPTIVMALPGTRDDAPHALAYRMADAVLGPWPPGAGVLRDGGAADGKRVEVGAISRFARRGAEETASAGLAAPAARTRSVLVLSGRGGTALTRDDLAAARAATPGWDWTVLGPPGDRWVPDPWRLLTAADVVVTHAGQNAIADVATARRPAIVLPQDRPFGEQHATAAALARLGLATVLDRWPAPDRWPGLLAAAHASGGEAWAAWTLDGRGAARAAEAIERVAAGTARARAHTHAHAREETPCAPR